VQARISLVVGLGNPGKQYEGTRHNLGFRVAGAFARRHEIKMRQQAKFFGAIGKGTAFGREIQVLLPETYMNESGRAVRTVADFFNVRPEEIIVVCDDVELPFGTMRVRLSGGSGGHRGLKSVAEHLGTQEFARMRIGVGRGLGEQELSDYVLARFAQGEEEKLGEVVEQAVKALDSMIQIGEAL
jgi:peptidyl-tRNA hydrolase, PTH1 family